VHYEIVENGFAKTLDLEQMVVKMELIQAGLISG